MGLKTFFTTMTLKVKIIIACTVLAVAGAITAGVLLNAEKTDTYRVLKVFELTGSAVVTRQSTGDIDAYVGMNLESGDTLTVCDDSVMRISMDGDKYLLLDEGTVLELVAEGTSADSRTSILLKEGTILNELTTSLSANSSYEVATPKATMAVRGTSFMISVEKNEDGSYIIRTNTLHGKVEVMLLDSEGRPTGDSVFITEDKSVVIKTVPDSESGNPAEIDGTSFFVYEIEPGVFVEVPEGEDPVSNIVYEYISAIIKEYALRSDAEKTMELNDYIIRKLRGDSGEESSAVTTSETSAEETVSNNDNVTTAAVIGTEDSETVTTTVPAAVYYEGTSATTVPTTVSTTVTTTESVTVPTTVSPTVTTTETTTVPTTVTIAETTTVPTAVTIKEKMTVTTTVPTTVTTTETTTVPTTVPTTVTTTETTTVPTTVPTTVTTTETTTVPTTVPTTVTTTETTTVPTTVTTTETTTVPTTVSETESETTTTVVEIPSYTVSFMKDGSTVYTVDINDGGTVTNIPDVPAKEGHTGKWMVGSAEFTTTTVITGDTIVDAEYTPIEYTVTFRVDGVDKYTRTAKYNTSVTDIPAVPAKTGHENGKWMVGSAEFTTTTVITEDTLVVAEYTPIEYTVTFRVDGVDKYTRTAKYNTSVTDIPAVPAKTGHENGKWMVGSAEFTTTTVITEDTIVAAEYTPIEYTVTFRVDGVDKYTRTAKYNTSVTDIPAVPAKTGHENGKWMVGSAEFTTTTVITEDTIVEAEYTPIEYTVTFRVDGVDKYTRTAKYNTSVTDIPAVPAKTGHENGKWMIGSAEFTTTTVITEDTIVVAEYTPIEYTVTFRVDGVDKYIRTAKYNTSVTDIPAVPAKTGHENGKWMIGSAEFTTTTVITEDTIVVAEYTPIEYTVIFKSGSNTVSTKKVKYGETVTDIPAVPGKTGYTGKWMYNSAEFTETIVVTDNMIVDAEYTIITCTVTFTEGSTVVKTVQADYGTKVTEIPTATPKTGHTVKWMVGTEEFTELTVIEGDTSVVAVYTPIKYTVTFTEGSTVVKTVQADYGTKVTEIPTATPKTGHTVKWMVGSSEFTALTVIEGDTSVEAVYTPIKYTVTFTEGSTVVKTVQADYGTKVSDIPTATSKIGHTVKWMVGSSEFTELTVIEGDTSVVAEYTPIKYTVTFTAVGDTSVNETVQADYGTTLAAADIPAIPTKTGHENGKWMVGTSEFTTSTVIKGNTNVVAKYTPIKYTVTFRSDDGTVVKTVQADYDTTLSSIDPPANRTGYTAKWMVGTSEFTTSTVIKGNTNVVAEYTPIKYTVTFTAVGDTSVNETVQADYGTTLAAADIPAIPTKTGHENGKWMVGTSEFTTSTVIKGNTNVVAEYTPIKYTVTFTAAGDTSVNETVQADYGTTLAAAAIPAIPTKTGHENGKWMVGTEEFTSSTVIKGNTNVVAEYTPIEYTVTFRVDGVGKYTRTAKYNTSVTDIPAVPEKTGYKDGKWVIGGTEFTTTTVITEDTFVDTDYTPINYTIRYILGNDHSVIIEAFENLHYGDAIPTFTPSTVYEAGSNKYYLYKPWEQPTGTVTEDKDYYVNYELYNNIRELKITSFNRVEVAPHLVKVGDTIVLPTEAAEYEGYEFVGWGHVTSGGYSNSSVKSGSTDVADYAINYDDNGYWLRYAPGESVTLTDEISLDDDPYYFKNFKFVAVYSKIPEKYTLTFVDESGNELLSKQYDEGTQLSDILSTETSLQKAGYNIETYKDVDGTRYSILPTNYSVSQDDTFIVKYVSQS